MTAPGTAAVSALPVEAMPIGTRLRFRKPMRLSQESIRIERDNLVLYLKRRLEGPTICSTGRESLALIKVEISNDN
jgi:hypothetical protein